MKTTDKSGVVIATKSVTNSDDLMVITNKGQTIRIHLNEVRSMGRNTQGVRLINVNESERVVGIEHLAERDEDETTNGNGSLGGPTEAPGTTTLQ